MAETNEAVKLLGVWASPFSKRVEIALKLKGVEYKFFKEDLANKSDALLNYNPVQKKIPVLVHCGKPISESLIIVEYIDETWKDSPILPDDPYDRATARFWAKFIDDKLIPALFKACWSKVEQDREKSEAELLECMSFLEKELKDKFFGGETIGLVDIAALFLAYWLPLLQEAGGRKVLTSEKFPKLVAWGEDFASHPVIKETLPPRDRLTTFFKARVQAAVA